MERDEERERLEKKWRGSGVEGGRGGEVQHLLTHGTTTTDHKAFRSSQGMCLRNPRTASRVPPPPPHLPSSPSSSISPRRPHGQVGEAIPAPPAVPCLLTRLLTPISHRPTTLARSCGPLLFRSTAQVHGTRHGTCRASDTFVRPAPLREVDTKNQKDAKRNEEKQREKKKKKKKRERTQKLYFTRIVV